MIDIDAITKEIVEREKRNRRNSEREAKAIKTYNEDLLVKQVYHQMLKDGTIKQFPEETI